MHQLYNTLLVEPSGPLLYVTLNRPTVRNAFNSEMIEELTQVYRQAEEDEEVRVVIMKANGPAFSAGADLSYLQQLQQNTLEENKADSNKLEKLFTIFYKHSKLLVAAVNGAAIAGGCGLVTAADIVYAAPQSIFGYTEVRIGFIPAVVSLVLLRKIGESKGRQLLLTGEIISAQEAEKIGLVHHLVEEAELEEHVERECLKIARSTSPLSIRMTRQLIYEVSDQTFDEAMKVAAVRNAEARGTADCKRGISAFLKKEKLDWTEKSQK